MREKIIDVLLDCGINREDIEVEDLMSLEDVDSLMIAEIIMNLEDTFGIEFDGEDIIPENFTNVDDIERLVNRYSSADGSRGGTIKERMWDMIAGKVTEDDAIKQSGWVSSFTGEYFSKKEMEEYSQNTYLKLKPYLNESCIVLELGIASGITARSIAPYVKKYIGIDISGETIQRTKISLEKEGFSNIKLLKGSAAEIDKLKIGRVDIVIINSVAQYFADFEEYKEVIKKASDILKSGIIYVGDVLDLGKKEAFLQELKQNSGRTNKNDLWYSRKFMKDIIYEVPNVDTVLISDKKAWTIENEMTKYRYDVIYEIGVKNDEKNIEGENIKE